MLILCVCSVVVAVVIRLCRLLVLRCVMMVMLLFVLLAMTIVGLGRCVSRPLVRPTCVLGKNIVLGSLAGI